MKLEGTKEEIRNAVVNKFYSVHGQTDWNSLAAKLINEKIGSEILPDNPIIKSMNYIINDFMDAYAKSEIIKHKKWLANLK